MFLIALCEDEPAHAQDILHGVETFFGDKRREIRTFASSQQLLEQIAQGYQPHIALLDICLPDVNGIDLAQQINHLLPDCQIIFITSFISFAPDAYEADHLYFVLKAQLRQRLGTALQRAVDALRAKYKRLLLRKDGASYMIPLDDILYVERTLRKTEVSTPRDTFVSRQTPAELLSGCDGFIRCHQSYWVNLSHVKCMENNYFVLDTGVLIPISRTYQHDARQQFFRALVIG